LERHLQFAAQYWWLDWDFARIDRARSADELSPDADCRVGARGGSGISAIHAGDGRLVRAAVGSRSRAAGGFGGALYAAAAAGAGVVVRGCFSLDCPRGVYRGRAGVAVPPDQRPS